MELSKAPTVPFNIFAKYCHVKAVGDEATLCMSRIGLSKSIKKFDILFVEEK
jgi:hypothetical protein